MPSAFHTPNEHNSSHKKPITHQRIRTAEEFNKRGQLISTLKRTFYKESAAKEEDRRWRRGRGDNAKDGAVDICWPLSPSCT
jgi:hypothetical protein